MPFGVTEMLSGAHMISTQKGRMAKTPGIGHQKIQLCWMLVRATESKQGPASLRGESRTAIPRGSKYPYRYIGPQVPAQKTLQGQSISCRSTSSGIPTVSTTKTPFRNFLEEPQKGLGQKAQPSYNTRTVVIWTQTHRGCAQIAAA